ncbi:MAG: 23S rRNA (guanosine(2251)-2'-O)-methyltransferase RlmB [Treponema sp.]|nr:23S rRNA (guanosine(2251)-2'-O)-methyltransferase RlmB [Treponema sp.]
MVQNIYTGFHAVEEKVRRYADEALHAKKTHDGTLKIYYSKPGPRIKKIISMAREAGIIVVETDDDALGKMVVSLPKEVRDHRGIVLVAEELQEKAKNLVQLDQWLSSCPETATVVMLDSVTDPHNVGAILRSCDQFGASLLILPERRGASDVQDNEIIARTSAGASAYIPTAVVTNLVRAAEMLKQSGFWIYGADADGSPLQNTDFDKKTCIVMGSEGSGISRLLSKNCDTVVSIPTCGKIDSLNVSVAAGVLLYERYRQVLANTTH